MQRGNNRLPCFLDRKKQEISKLGPVLRDITFDCPGNFTAKGAQHPFLGGESSNARFLPLPISKIKVDSKRTIDSTFALDQLTETAKNSTPSEFIALMLPIFGYDIPATTYIRLHKALQSGQIANPEHVVAEGSGYPAEFDNSTRKIHVHYAAADHATESREGAWELLTILLHEFGHYIDLLLRTDFAEKDTSGKPLVPDDSEKEEGARYAYAIARLDLEKSSETTFANYQSPGYDGPLKVNYHEARVAIQQSQGQDAQQLDGRRGDRETFGAGRGEHNKNSPATSFGHESIEDVLVDVGFRNAADRSQIYFGNWLRDYSQICDPKIIRKPGAAKDITKHLSRQSLTDVMNVLAEVKFVNPANDANQKKIYAVDTSRLGVYRPSEHIDNPKNDSGTTSNPQSIDRDFEAPATPHDTAVDPATSMKNYFAKSVAYMVRELDTAAALGATPDGRRHFGSALHVLEDFFAHSNFVELCLRKLGHTDVLPWTSKTDCRHGYPLVTGMFGSTDVIASIAAPIADVIFDVDYALAKPSKERTPSDRIILILLREHGDAYYLDSFNKYLRIRDKIAEYEFLHYAKEILTYPLKAVISSQNLVFNSLLHLVGNTVDDHQVLVENKNQNIDGSTDPTHSQVAKDHDNHPLHVLAALLAKRAVKDVGTAMYKRWQGDFTASPANIAKSYFKHPMDTSWQDQDVRTWAGRNPAKVKSATSATDLERLHKMAEDELEKLLSQTVVQGNDTWAYVNRYYEDIYGEKNQVSV